MFFWAYVWSVEEILVIFTMTTTIELLCLSQPFLDKTTDFREVISFAFLIYKSTIISLCAFLCVLVCVWSLWGVGPVHGRYQRSVTFTSGNSSEPVTANSSFTQCYITDVTLHYGCPQMVYVRVLYYYALQWVFLTESHAAETSGQKIKSGVKSFSQPRWQMLWS